MAPGKHAPPSGGGEVVAPSRTHSLTRLPASRRVASQVRLQRVAKEKLVGHEREVALSLKGEAAIMRKKLEASQSDMDALKGQLKAREREITKMQREGAERDLTRIPRSAGNLPRTL